MIEIKVQRLEGEITLPRAPGFLKLKEDDIVRYSASNSNYLVLEIRRVQDKEPVYNN